MSLENTNLSRRNLLRAGALGVPAAGVLAFGSTLVTATSANAISADGWWGEETSAGLQMFLNTVVTNKGWFTSEEFSKGLVVDGVISSQPSRVAPQCPAIVGGWEWVDSNQAEGSPTIKWLQSWLDLNPPTPFFDSGDIFYLQRHYGIPQDGRLDGPSQTIMALQNEINQVALQNENNYAG